METPNEDFLVESEKRLEAMLKKKSLKLKLKIFCSKNSLKNNQKKIKSGSLNERKKNTCFTVALPQ